MPQRILIALLCFWATLLHAQTDIEPTLVFSDTASFQFSGEWQYLSTDIYLFNGEKFSALINELDFVRLGREERSGIFRRRSELAEEYLEYLFITARLKNVRFFGSSEITYPLYNFQIQRDSDKKYHTYVSDNIDKIRIIDNLPLYSASDFIDAEIQVRAITNNDRDQILGMVGAQLQNLARLQTPTHAIMGIIGEFGSFIESNTKQREYRFSSTIRLFEQKNFDTRLHSIRVYALLTQNSTPTPLNTELLSALLDTASMPEISRNALAELIDYRQYPLIVVANYKSLYRMEQVTGDEVNFANIEKRKLKIENDFRAGLINAETYRQERDFINFINVFAHLKNHLEVYSLNYRTGNIDAVSGTLFTILQYYRQLFRTHQEMQLKYRGNTTFQSVFSKEYESILEYASLYLDDDHNLRSLKELVQTLFALEQSPVQSSITEMETTIRALRFADLIKHPNMEQSVEGQALRMHIQRIENELLAKRYRPVIEQLQGTTAIPANRFAPDTLRSLLRTTACIACREAALEAIDSFGKRLTEYQRGVAITSLDSLNRSLQPWIFSQMQTTELASHNVDILFPPNRQGQTNSFIRSKLLEVERDLGNLVDFSRTEMRSKELHLIEGMIDRLLSTQKRALDNIQMVCNLNQKLCQELEIAVIPELPKDSIEVYLEEIAPPAGNSQADSLLTLLQKQISNFDHRLDSIMALPSMRDPKPKVIDKLEIIIATQNQLVRESQRKDMELLLNSWGNTQKLIDTLNRNIEGVLLLIDEQPDSTINAQ